MANGAVYSDTGGIENIHDRKLDALEDIIEAANGKSLLVAYWYKHDLSRITKRLEELGVNYGKLDTDGSIHDWNAGRLDVGLIHPASAGHGLTCRAAEARWCGSDDLERWNCISRRWQGLEAGAGVRHCGGTAYPDGGDCG